MRRFEKFLEFTLLLTVFALRLILHMFFGYLIGLWLSDGLFSATISATQWDNIWTYAWLLFWPIGLFCHFLFFLWDKVYYLLAIVGVTVLWYLMRKKESHVSWR